MIGVIVRICNNDHGCNGSQPSLLHCNMIHPLGERVLFGWDDLHSGKPLVWRGKGNPRS